MHVDSADNLSIILSRCFQSGAQAALQAADQMIGGMEEPHAVLRAIVDNMLYPITVEIIKQVGASLKNLLHTFPFQPPDLIEMLILKIYLLSLTVSQFLISTGIYLH